MAIELIEGSADEGMTERVMFVQVLLAAADELEDEQVIEQRPRFLDDDLGDCPVVVAFLARLVNGELRHVNGLARATRVERTGARGRVGRRAGRRT